jgi:hypothetical protein
MADYGAFFIADDGTLLVTSDSPCYEFVAEVTPSSRTGNVNTYSVNTTVVPLIFVKCGSGYAGGVLAITGSSGSWTVSVLSDVSCNIEVFVPITGASTTGVGMAIYKSDGTPVFDSSKKILNARVINDLSEGVSFATPSGTDMVAYVSGPVKPASSTSDETVLVDSYGYTDRQYVCRQNFENVCTTNYEYVCRSQYVTSSSYQCTTDFSGNTSCGFVTTSGYQNVCGYEYVTSCSYQYVQHCGFEYIQTFADIYASVRTTTWTIERAVAKILDTTISFSWLLHQSGYYKEILSYDTQGYTLGLTSFFLPSGYIPPVIFINNNTNYSGALTKDNRYPYTTSRANTGALACITSIRSDYD